jgi:hypothetical protein
VKSAPAATAKGAKQIKQLRAVSNVKLTPIIIPPIADITKISAASPSPRHKAIGNPTIIPNANNLGKRVY